MKAYNYFSSNDAIDVLARQIICHVKNILPQRRARWALTPPLGKRLSCYQTVIIQDNCVFLKTLVCLGSLGAIR